MWALGTIGDARAADPLAAVLTTDGVSGVCDAAAEALIRLRDARGIVRGVPMLVLRIRRSTQGALTDYQSVGDLIVPLGASAVPPLIDLLQHSDADVQELAIKTLVRLADARAVEPLIALLQEASPPIRRAVAEALAKLGDVRATEALVAALGDKDPEVRQTSANLLARSGPRAVEPLIAALSAEDEVLRREAARVLALLRDARAVEPLVAALDDPVEEVRWAAANTLIALGDQQAIEPLIRLLMRGDVVPTGFLDSLLRALRRAVRNVPSETLRELTLLESVLGPPTRLDMGHGFSRSIDNRVDCPELRQLARQELTRRGIEE